MKHVKCDKIFTDHFLIQFIAECATNSENQSHDEVSREVANLVGSAQ